MPEENIIRVKNDLYVKAKDMAETEGISMADAITKLVEQGWSQPSVCELVQFRKVLESKGLTPPSRPDTLSTSASSVSISLSSQAISP